MLAECLCLCVFVYVQEVFEGVQPVLQPFILRMVFSNAVPTDSFSVSVLFSFELFKPSNRRTHSHKLPLALCPLWGSGTVAGKKVGL